MPSTKLPSVFLLIPNFGFGGAQRVLADHSRLLEGKAAVTEVVFNDWEEKRVYETGHPYRSLEVGGGGHPLARAANFFRRIRRLRALKQAYRPEVTVSHLEGADYVSLLSGGADRKVIVIHGSKVADQNIRGLTGALRHKVLMPWLYKKAHRIVTVSKDIRAELIAQYGLPPEKIVALPNFFDCAAIREKAAQPVDGALLPLFGRASSFKLITFARLADQKNLGVLFPLLAALKARGLDVQLFVLGDGELREPLLAAAARYGTVWQAWSGAAPDPGHDIFFLGYQSAPHGYLRYADLYLMTSLWEGFPMALCEAMASGIAVAAADCPTGPAEILDPAPGQGYGIGGNGLLLPMIQGETDTAALAQWTEAILALAADRGRLEQLREAAGRRVQHYDRSQVGPRWLAAYLND